VVCFTNAAQISMAETSCRLISLELNNVKLVNSEKKQSKFSS